MGFGEIEPTRDLVRITIEILGDEIRDSCNLSQSRRDGRRYVCIKAQRCLTHTGHLAVTSRVTGAA